MAVSRKEEVLDVTDRICFRCAVGNYRSSGPDELKCDYCGHEVKQKMQRQELDKMVLDRML